MQKIKNNFFILVQHLPIIYIKIYFIIQFFNRNILDRENMKAEKDVQPIRNQQQLDDMKWALKRHCPERDYILFLLGCETGLRVGDLLRLPTHQILALKGKQNKILRVKEGKTQKIRDIYIANCFQEVYAYAQNVQSACLFPSRKGDSSITPTQAYRQLNKAAEYAGVEHVGNHTLLTFFC